MTAAQIGALLRSRREGLGLSLAQLVEQTTITSPQYLHNLEAGRINAARSKHLPSLARALQLTTQEQAAILGVQVVSAAQDGGGTEAPSPADVLRPLTLSHAMLLATSRPTAWCYHDEVIVVDQSDVTPVAGRTYLVSPDGPNEFVLARAVTGSAGQVVLVSDTHAWDAQDESVGIVGRVVHRGRAL